MNIIKRTYHRLTGVLGYDYQGKPLRKGDIVYPRFPRKVKEPFQFGMEVINTTAPSNRHIGDVKVISPDGEAANAFSHDIKKEPPLAKNASWKNTENITGWKPASQEVEHG
ncbi:hypothetical protein LG331_09785 [Vreelandella aquamarina]|uniref:hypothetical protein n=1 Tax=Vreelandella aquamarina TaxID=77097 RepID=UPI00384C9D8F